jgi:phosphoglycerol transferase MdoB-like AlkP superfamily enzyme
MKKFTFIFAMAAIVMAMAPTAATFAKKGNNTRNEVVRTGNISVKQYGSDDRYVYLQVSLAQNNEKPATFRITDNFGDLLFSDRIITKNHTMMVKFRPEELEKIHLELVTSEGVYRKELTVEVKTFSSAIVKEVEVK